MGFARWSVSMVNARFALSLILLAGLSCSSVAAPDHPSTLLVTNATCLAGRCDSLEILAFPSTQPNTPGGLWSLDLGLSTTPQACFSLPSGAKFLIIAVNPDGTRDTTTIPWTSGQSLALGTLAPSGNRFAAMPSTNAFTPARSPGWSITLPGGVDASPRAACTSH